MKIKYSLLSKMLESQSHNRLTNKEISFFMEIAQYQDDCGRIEGIYYRNICKDVQMCKQTFYSTLRSLKKKGFITYEREISGSDYNIQILDNDFSYPESYREGYINVSRKVFHTRPFRQLKGQEKLLLLQFMKITHSSSSSYQIGTDKFYNKYMQLMGVTKRVLRGYLHSLKKFFAIGVKEGKYFISYLRSVFHERTERSETDTYMGHMVGVSCRRAKIKRLSRETQKDLISLLKQYRQEAREQGKDIFKIIEKCIRFSVQQGAQELNGKYIHRLVRSALGWDRDNVGQGTAF